MEEFNSIVVFCWLKSVTVNFHAKYFHSLGFREINRLRVLYQRWSKHRFEERRQIRYFSPNNTFSNFKKEQFLEQSYPIFFSLQSWKLNFFLTTRRYNTRWKEAKKSDKNNFSLRSSIIIIIIIHPYDNSSLPTSNSSSKIGVNASHRMLRFFHPLIKLSPTNLIFHGKPCRNRARRRNEKKNGKFTKRVNACCTTKGGERERREKTEKKGLKGPRRGPAGSIRALLRAAWCGTKRNGRVLLSHLEEKNSFATDISGKRLDWIREERSKKSNGSIVRERKRWAENNRSISPLRPGKNLGANVTVSSFRDRYIS